MLNEKITRIIVEEVTRAEIRGIVSSEKDELLNSKEFANKVKELSSKVIEELYKILWTRKSFWLDPIKK
jgi:hypothetical protein